MRKRRFMQVDVFSHRAGLGNPLAVVIDSDGLDTAQMQQFAAWMNLSETSFLLPPTQAAADYRVRIFTPRQELPFAGHPSVGAAWVAMESGMVRPREGCLIQQCAAGLLDVRVETSVAGTRTHVCAPDARIRELNPDRQVQLSSILSGIGGFDLHSGQLVNNGPEWLLVELPDEESVRRFQPPLGQIAELCVEIAAVGLAIFARCDGKEFQLVVRAFCPADGIPEDPVTGSANAAIAALLHDNGQINAVGSTYRASQGREMGRDGIVEVSVDESGQVWIGGNTVAAIEGSLMWPC